MRKKDCQIRSAFLLFFGSACIKAADKHVGEIDPIDAKRKSLTQSVSPTTLSPILPTNTRRVYDQFLCLTLYTLYL